MDRNMDCYRDSYTVGESKEETMFQFSIQPNQYFEERKGVNLIPYENPSKSYESIRNEV